MNHDWRAGEDAHSLALELEQRALMHEKVLDHLDLRAARALRELARRIREVAALSEKPDADRQRCHVESLKLRLEAMSSLLTELATKAPRLSPPRSSPQSSPSSTQSPQASPASQVPHRSGLERGESKVVDLAVRRAGSGR